MSGMPLYPAPIRVVFLASECEPWAKTGGLADVVDALARALGQAAGGALETPVDVFLPRYRSIDVPEGSTSRPVDVPDPHALGGRTRVQIIDVAADGYRLRLVDHPAAYDRAGFYGDGTRDFPDNAWRFGLFCRAALEALRLEGRPPDVLHLHDWHTGPAAILRDTTYRDDPALGDPAILLTVHNLAYHGWTPLERLAELGLAPGDGVVEPEAPGLDLLGTAIERAELVNTVSPGFAAEATTPAFGMGLDGALRAKGDHFVGILNGLDVDLWDPAADPVLAATYGPGSLGGKAACRADLLARLELDREPGGMVLGMIGRLDPQKGFDLLAAAAPGLLDDGTRLVVQGSGDPALVLPLRELAARHPGRIALVERFDREMARRIYGGVDAFLMPSRFEPCGTGQMIAMRYATPPIVHATGGLADTVLDVTEAPRAGTGFVFREATPAALLDACRRAAALHGARGPAWGELQARGMAAGLAFDWRTGSAPRYVEAYRRAIAIRRAATTYASQEAGERTR
jgi:starch synthase